MNLTDIDYVMSQITIIGFVIMLCMLYISPILYNFGDNTGIVYYICGSIANIALIFYSILSIDGIKTLQPLIFPYIYSGVSYTIIYFMNNKYSGYNHNMFNIICRWLYCISLGCSIGCIVAYWACRFISIL